MLQVLQVLQLVSLQALAEPVLVIQRWEEEERGLEVVRARPSWRAVDQSGPEVEVVLLATAFVQRDEVAAAFLPARLVLRHSGAWRQCPCSADVQLRCLVA